MATEPDFRSPLPSAQAGSDPDPLARLRRELRIARIRIAVLSVLVEPFLLLLKGRQYRRWFLGRSGVFRGRAQAGGLWIHAIGMGEMRVARALVSALPRELPVVVTSSYKLVRNFFWEHLLQPDDRAADAVVTLPPFPFSFAVRGFLRHFAPRMLVLIEATDLSPLVNLHLTGQEIPAALLNAWVNKDWFDLRPSVPVLKKLQFLGVRAEADCELLAGFGISRERISLLGEIKFDAIPSSQPAIEAEMRKLAGERPILVAGSTHPDEEPQVLEAFERLGGGDRAMLILAPRLRDDLSEKLLRQRGIPFVRRSRFPISGRPAVVLLDSLGELASLYRLAAAVFVGNSLSPKGRGHNPIEPACFAVPIAVGPNMAHFEFHADLFDRAGAWQRVTDAGELASIWSSWLDAPDLGRQIGRRAADLVESQRGLALAKALELLRPCLGLPSPQDALPPPA